MTAELKQRLSMSALGIPFLLAVFYFGGWWLWGFLLIFSVFGLFEFRKMLVDNNPNFGMTELFLVPVLFVSMTVFNIFPPIFSGEPSVTYNVYFTLVLVLQLFVPYGGRSNHYSVSEKLHLILGLAYTVGLPALIYHLGVAYHKEQLLLLLIVMIWITDSAAYFVGMNFGKHRGIFPMSPNKSLEGFLAGFVAPFVFMLLFYRMNHFWTIKQLVLVCLSAGLAGQMGDLLESKLKRIAGVKDSSHLIPGHGGVLDRFDSLLLAAPVLYILLKLIP